MTTPQRVWYEGAAYHITARGNHNYQLICYCLMDNHVHLMIKTDDKPLANLISRISSIYTRYFNKVKLFR